MIEYEIWKKNNLETAFIPTYCPNKNQLIESSKWEATKDFVSINPIQLEKNGIVPG